MQKLLAAFKANPTAKNAKAVIVYGRKHPFSACFLNNEEGDLLIAAGRQVNGEA